MLSEFKGTLMQIRKSAYMFVFMQNQYPGNSAFLILTIPELFVVTFVTFLKSRPIFNIFCSSKYL